MKCEINFYQFDETYAKAMAPLLMKVLEDDKKAFIFTSDSKIKEIDDGLWSYGKNKFIPHVLFTDKDFDFLRQPIVISSAEKNLNCAEYLVLTQDASEDFISNFKRVFYFYSEMAADEAKSLEKKLKKISSQFNSYKKSEGKWVKSA